MDRRTIDGMNKYLGTIKAHKPCAARCAGSARFMGFILNCDHLLRDLRLKKIPEEKSSGLRPLLFSGYFIFLQVPYHVPTQKLCFKRFGNTPHRLFDIGTAVER